MSDSSNPSVGQQNEGNQTEPYIGGSSASSLGAPAPDAELETDGSESDDSDESATPDPDIKGDPDQVT